jgi:hypothetical protein
VLEFGVLGPRGGWSAFGANRNAILLQTAGGAVLSVDDDTLCESRAAAGADGVLVFSRPGVCPVVSA